MNESTRIYYESANALRLPVTYLESIHCMYIKLGKKKYFFSDNIPPINSGSSHILTKHRHVFFEMLYKAGFPIPNYKVLVKEEDWQQNLALLLKGLKFPLVIKPVTDTHNSKDVLCNIKTLDALIAGINNSFEQYAQIQIEEYHQKLYKYQILILNNTIISLMQHAPEAPQAMPQQCIHELKKIPKKNLKILRDIAQMTGLCLVSLDLLCDNILLPFSHSNWMILEANSKPEITRHMFPAKGPHIDVSKKILMHLIMRHPLAYCMHRFNLFFREKYDG